MRKPKPLTVAAVGVTLAVTALVASALVISLRRPSQNEAKYRAASDALRQVVTDELTHASRTPTDDVVIMLSYSDGEHRASVQTGTGPSLSAAWDDADAALIKIIRKSKYQVKYLKCDVVTQTESASTQDILDAWNQQIVPEFDFGIAFDDEFESSLLAQELDSLRPFTTQSLDEEYIKAYFRAAQRPSPSQFGEDVIKFSTRAWFLDPNQGQVLNLNPSGVRDNALDAESVTTIINSAGSYLVNHIDKTGEFQYLFYPQALADVDDYNIVRHAGALWSMTQSARTSGDERYKTALDAGIEYLKKHADYDEDGAAYIRNTDVDSYSLGTTGIAMLALSDYQETFGDDRYENLLKAIADGVVKNQADAGCVPHLLDANLQVEKPFSTVFYDGEATFGLCRAYHVTGDERYKTAATKYGDYMVANDYWMHADHWLAYSMNELTKLYPDAEKYYTLAFRNVYENYEWLERAAGYGPIRLELLMATFETYRRALENDIPIPDEFDVARFLNIINEQVHNQLDCYLYPERAMYTAACDEVTGAFYDNSEPTWEIRIDTVQHHIGGFWLYLQNLDALRDAMN